MLVVEAGWTGETSVAVPFKVNETAVGSVGFAGVAFLRGVLRPLRGVVEKRRPPREGLADKVVGGTAGDARGDWGEAQGDARRALRLTAAGVPFSFAAAGVEAGVRCGLLRLVTGVPSGMSGVPSCALNMPGVRSKSERANAEGVRGCRSPFGVPVHGT